MCFYNTKTKQHLITSDASEIEKLKNQSSTWIYEGVAWQTVTAGTKTYRFRNKQQHYYFYTTSTKEVELLKSRKAQFNILNHVSQMDTTVTMVTDLQVDPDEYAAKVLRQLIASSAHREIIMHKNARHVAIGVNVYYNERFDVEEVVFTVTPVDSNGEITYPK